MDNINVKIHDTWNTIPRDRALSTLAEATPLGLLLQHPERGSYFPVIVLPNGECIAGNPHRDEAFAQDWLDNKISELET